MNQDIIIYQDRLDALFKKISLFPNDLELQSQWSRYLCILVSGFVEVAVRKIYGDYAKTKSAPNIANFVERELKDFQNPKMQKILDITSEFSLIWRDKLQVATDGQIKDSIDSIVANRNKIAHGEDVGIRYLAVKQYYEDALKLVQLLHTQCNG